MPSLPVALISTQDDEDDNVNMHIPFLLDHRFFVPFILMPTIPTAVAEPHDLRVSSPISSAQTVFLIPELVHEIALSARTQDLLSLALVGSYAFQETICVLWSHLPSPLPLLQLFKGLVLRHSRWTLAEPPSKKEWENFVFYSHSVHSFFSLLMTGLPGALLIDPDLFPFLQSICPSPFLFPQLRSVTLPSYDVEFITPFLTPRLSKASFVVPPSSATYLQDVSHICPYMESLFLHGFFDEHHLNDILHFQHLRHLTLELPKSTLTLSASSEEVAPPICIILSASLTSLEVQAPHELTFDISFISPPTSLIKLHLGGAASTVCKNLSYFGNLHEVSLEFTDDTTSTPQLLTAFKHIRESSEHVVTVLRVKSAGTASIKEAIVPLLKISRLKSFVYLHRAAHDLDLDNEDFRELVGAWPDLKRLALPININSSLYTLQVLQTLSRLQNLCFLQIRLHGRIVKLPLDPFSVRDDDVDHYLRRYFLRATWPTIL
ncbi:hypothetical protein NLJ89_g3534 [Agrocybe chaxingu]|uniref:F-box domain-containing protein n=1 Tax=Agrocybe chaxingu TaxID=84603 RepID=A0A9W8MVE5_9AGAR|nr:hypothetical protein NLJ89_g3534 [Agrocybe chaxingu]